MAIRRMIVAGLCPLIFGGCGLVTDPPPKPAQRVERPVQPLQDRRSIPTERAANAQDAFAQRILKASSTNGVITKAAMRGGNELGVVLGRQVQLKDIKPLMVTLLREMRQQFPGRDLTVRAYTPNGKPMATMKYDDS